MMFDRRRAHLLVSILGILISCCDAVRPRRRLGKDKDVVSTSDPTPSLTDEPTQLPIRSPTKEPTYVPAGATEAPLSFDVDFVPSPTALPATTFPTSVLGEPNAVLPSFDNNATVARVLLQDFEITIENDLDREYKNDREVITIYKREVRQSLQRYFHRNLGFDTILLVQLEEISTKRRTLAEIAESFSYGGRVDFREAAPSEALLQSRQRALLADPGAVQAFLNTENNYLRDMNVTSVELRQPVGSAAQQAADEKGDLSFVVILAVASGVALAVLLLLCVLLCRVCRPPPPPPPPLNVSKKAPYDTTPMDHTIASTSSAEHLQLAMTESTAALTVITEPGMRRSRSIPEIESKDSEDSMDGYSLGSGLYGRQQQQAKPSWMRPMKRSSPVPEYSSDSESQFTYEQVAGKKDASALGPVSSSEYDSDEEMALSTMSPPLVTTQTALDAILPDEPEPSILSNAAPEDEEDDDDDQSRPFDETMEDDEIMEDSIDQSFDAFADELEKVNRENEMFGNGEDDRGNEMVDNGNGEDDDATRLISNVNDDSTRLISNVIRRR